MKPVYEFQTWRLFVACLIFIVLVPKIAAQPQVIALHSFSKFANSFQTNADGNAPVGALLLVGTNLYGTAVTGGTYSQGTLFAVSTNGAVFTNLHTFGRPGTTDGQQPNCALMLSGNKLFGTLSQGGTTGSGGIFSINLDGGSYSNFYNFTAEVLNTNINRFTNKDGAFPFGGLVAAGNMLYGTTESGGKMGSGTIFAINTNGTGFTNLHDFSAISGPNSTNNDGGFSYDTLILSGSTLYGTGSRGGTGGYGTVFAISTNGSSFTNLHNFALNTSDGAIPMGGLLLADDVLYGTTSFAGDFAYGTIFKINTDGTGFAVLHEFSKETFGTNADGGDSHATLILSGDTLIGAGLNGGIYGSATIYTVNTNGNNFAAIYQFSMLDDVADTNFDGAFPSAGVILSGNTLYGTAKSGGYANRGSVFALALPVPPSLGIARAGTNVFVSWPTTAVGFDLQSCTDLLAANWTNTTASLAVLDTNFVFTNFASGSSAFFRLRR